MEEPGIVSRGEEHGLTNEAELSVSDDAEEDSNTKLRNCKFAIETLEIGPWTDRSTNKASRMVLKVSEHC